MGMFNSVEIIGKESLKPFIIIRRGNLYRQYNLGLKIPFTQSDFDKYIAKKNTILDYELSDEKRIKDINERLKEIEIIEAEKIDLINEKDKLTATEKK